jgi:hypothetical protein
LNFFDLHKKSIKLINFERILSVNLRNWLMNSLIKPLTLTLRKLNILIFFSITTVIAQENSDCFNCHSDKLLSGTREGKTIAVYIDEKGFKSSIHGSNDCITCHSDLAGKELPHDDKVERAQCTPCHSEVEEKYKISLHGKAAARGDRLAPFCKDCHGSHSIVAIKDARSNITPLKIPFICGKCHQEGTPVTRQREIPQANILENYSESIHGEGLLRKGLAVSASCASCHTAHEILPHTDSRSSIARRNIASTCSKCHTQIELVHRKIIRGELWEKESHILPACVDCHQPHKVRKVFYTQGMADKDCLRCHEQQDVKSSKDGHSLFVDTKILAYSRHMKIACSQCHTGVSPSHRRACETLTQKVDCSACHAEIGDEYKQSMHGTLFAQNDVNAPTCKECHGTHSVRGKQDPLSPTFPTKIPTLCARCHREGQKAAIRYQGDEHAIVEHYVESIHGKGLLKSGLTVTATCTDCHTAHRELPWRSPTSSVNPNNISSTCGRCHHGIEEQYRKSIHSREITKTEKELPVCSECHTAHTIRRADEQGFKLEIMNTCGRCHNEIARTYFDTYHGKVSQLGYVKTAKCYDCHGAHDILPNWDPKSHLSRQNVVATCQKCHPGANRRFAGYLTHATHHDPKKYPWLYWTFRGMTALLIITFVVGGLHTMLWLPRALRMRKELKKNIVPNNE